MKHNDCNIICFYRLLGEISGGVKTVSQHLPAHSGEWEWKDVHRE